jgi:hypothetical protein
VGLPPQGLSKWYSLFSRELTDYDAAIAVSVGPQAVGAGSCVPRLWSVPHSSADRIGCCGNAESAVSATDQKSRQSMVESPRSGPVTGFPSWEVKTHSAAGEVLEVK